MQSNMRTIMHCKPKPALKNAFFLLVGIPMYSFENL